MRVVSKSGEDFVEFTWNKVKSKYIFGRAELSRRPNFDNFQSVTHIDRVLHQGKVVSLVTLVCLGLRLALQEKKCFVEFSQS